MPPTDVQDKTLPVWGTLITAAVLLSWITGCSGTHTYTARNLPTELRAPRVENVQTLDLSRLAGPPVSSDLIDRGDLLEVSITAGLSADETLTFPVRVMENGNVFITQLGLLQLAGLRPTEAERQITAVCIQRNLFVQPQVAVKIDEQRENRIRVVGGVLEPGTYYLPRSSSYLLAALTAAGSLAEDAGTQITIQRPASNDGGVRMASHSEPSSSSSANQPTLISLNLAEVVNRPGGGYYLPDGSVVRVEKRQPAPISVVGLVRSPGQYDFPLNHDLRVFAAIALGGGKSSQLADKVFVMRYHPETQELTTIRLSLRSAKDKPEENLLLAPGDIVIVEQTTETVIADILTSMIRFGMSASIPVF